MAKGDVHIVLADLHAGSTVAPWATRTQLPDGGTYRVNKYQAYLNKCFNNALKEIALLKPRTIIFNGDIIQGGNPARDTQIVSGMMSVHADCAYNLLDPLTKLDCTRYYVRGTEYHEGRGSDLVDALAVRLGCKVHPTTHSPTWRRLYLQTGAGVIDFMHHISVTSIRQYMATAPLRDAMNHQLELLTKYGGKMPRIAATVRAHRHTYIQVANEGVIAATCPAWQMSTSYTDQKANVVLSDIGFLIIEEGAKTLGITPVLYETAKPHIEVVE
jgi:hypothetical protein